MTFRQALTLPRSNLVLAGILIMLLGNFMFALNDAMGKWLVASYSVGQVLFVRSLGAFIVLAPMIAKQGTSQLIRLERPGLQALRVFLATADTAFFYAAVMYLPLADVMTFYMAGPIYIAALSHLFLGEKVGWRRWLAIVVGFCGVVIALKPSSSSLSMASLFAVLGSISFAVSMILGRRLRGTSDTTLVTWQTVGALAMGLVLAVADWRPASAMDWSAMLLLGVVAGSAHLLITRALKLAPASTLAPFQYTLLLWGVVFGIVFFGDIPDNQLFVGSGIIILAGLFIFHRQKVIDGGEPDNVPRNVN
ncbi:DMT family transporter [Pseudaminobacter soli (ex Li et al. 2025)]|uniref:EamA family transporter n=1 Tax=Pseudaminobacter soli (ex Li et al. 2025) TaxID=1295366 RepID=A0A2P7SGL2_9HYPH|nr:DMT family transporter [Mesorhizobium soli]PSJ61632.1 EamA family transporter [Mesorhizobium soli]